MKLKEEKHKKELYSEIFLFISILFIYTRISYFIKIK